MKKKKKWNKGGLRKKVFALCIVIVITAICGFALMGMIQLRTLQKMANETGELQALSVREQSEASMMQMAEKNMKNMAFSAADNTNWEVWELRNQAVTLAAQVEDVFLHPENYAETQIEPPKLENAGKLALQLMYSETANPSEEDMVMVHKLANLGPLMAKMIEDAEFDTQDLIISFPSGVSIFMDVNSGVKFGENGELLPYDPLVRPWWKAAVETHDVVLTHAVHSTLLNVSEFEFGVPVYVGDELVAIVESSMKLETFQEIVSVVDIGETGFSIVVSDDGKLIYSPRTEGELKMDDMLSSDVLGSGNESLNDVITTALTGEIGFRENVIVDGGVYCVAYAPMQTANWTQMLFLEQAELEKPTDKLVQQLDMTMGTAIREYERSFRQSSWLTLGVMVLLVANAVLVALMFSGKLTNPINRMTESVRQITGDNFNFEMDNVYRTGDEIELLAQTFGELSARTKKYIKEIMEITAEKERIGAELSIATKIQADMLPKKFPLFPERKDFDVFASMTPAKEVAGDFYDIFMIDDDHLCLVVADVSGKGIPAALFMMVSKTLLENRALMGGTPAEIFTDVNKRLCDKNEEAMFVTVWMAIITLSTGHVIEANAGHEYPAIKKKDGDYELLQTQHGFVMGGYHKSQYENLEYDIAPGDRIFVYTDGVPEATDTKGERFEMERMVVSLNNHKDEEPEELLRSVREDVDKFVGEAEQFDDLTMLSFVYHPDRAE